MCQNNDSGRFVTVFLALYDDITMLALKRII